MEISPVCSSEEGGAGGEDAGVFLDLIDGQKLVTKRYYAFRLYTFNEMRRGYEQIAVCTRRAMTSVHWQIKTGLCTPIMTLMRDLLWIYLNLDACSKKISRSVLLVCKRRRIQNFLTCSQYE